MALSNLGPYRLLERLGAGANGEVFLAEDVRLHRRVAIKTLTGTAAADADDLRRRMLREARAAARLNDPRIAAVYDVLESDEGVHIVMEYVEGCTLAARVRVGPLPPIEVLDVALQLGAALLHAHSLGVIHRDLKPANIVISPQGRAKILDFGLARRHALNEATDAGSVSDSTGGEAGHIVGTPPYMPPEHLRGEPIDERGDIYSLGVTLFELLTGRRPFDGHGRAALTAAILGAPTPRSRSFNPDVPEGLDAVVAKAMARDPRDRYASAGEMLSDLERLQSEITDPSTRSHRLPRSVRTTSRVAVTVAAVLAVLIVAAALHDARNLTWGRAETAGSAASAGQTPNVVAVLPLVGAAVDPETESLATGVADSLITTLSKVSGVTVVSRAATLKYRERKLGPDAIARELGATLLVDGGLQRVGDRLRITVSLLPVGTNVVRWQGAYDGNFADLFTLQTEAAEAVARAVATPSDETHVRRPAAPAPDVEAVADAAQARVFLERPDIKDNVDRAIELFQGAIRKDAHYARAHAGLGEALWRKFQATREDTWATRARDEINEALRLDPDDISVRYSLAAVYAGMGRVEEAIEELRRVAALQPSADDAHRLLGQLLTDTGHKAEAEQEIRKAISLRPNYWAHHYALGQLYYGAGRYREAITAFQRVSELQPDNAWGHQMLGVCYHALNEIPAAIAHYDKAIALGNGAAYSNLGTIYARQGKVSEAERCYKAAIKIAPTAPKYHNLGDLYASVGRKHEADEQYRRAAELATDQLRSRPRDIGVLAALAMVEAKLGRVSEANTHMTQAIAIAPDNADVRFAEAIVASLRGRTEDGLAALAKALAAGYSAERAAQDPDLGRLKVDPRFSPLLRTAMAPNQEVAHANHR